MSGSFPAEKQLAAQMRIPAEIAALMQRLEREGFAVYAVGGCVRDTLLGKKPCDWDLATNAGLDRLKEIFPEGRTLSSKFAVIRVTAAAADGRTDVDIAAFRREESYENGRPAVFSFVDSIEEDLPRRDFTINAMAAGSTRFIDLFAGSADLQKKLIRTVGPAKRRFSEDPLRMLRAVRLACELDFELDGELVQAIASCRGLLPLAAPGKVRDELIRLLSAPRAGRGLQMLLDLEMAGALLQTEGSLRLGGRETSRLRALSENIERTQALPARRLGLFFTCLHKKRALAAIAKLEFDDFTACCLTDAVTELDNFYFLNSKAKLKRFICEKGWERYDYLCGLEKAQHLAFAYDNEARIRSRRLMLQEITETGEAIFPQDLAVDSAALIDAGLCAEEESAQKLLERLLAEVHKDPDKNERSRLLELARTYSRGGLAAAWQRLRRDR